MADFIMQCIAICCSSDRAATESLQSASEAARAEERRRLANSLTGMSRAGQTRAEAGDASAYEPVGALRGKLSEVQLMDCTASAPAGFNAEVVSVSFASLGKESESGSPPAVASEVVQRTTIRRTLHSQMSTRSIASCEGHAADGETPLLRAVRLQDLQGVRRLLGGKDLNQKDHEEGDLNQRDNDGATPLLVACAIGLMEIAVVLLSARADPNLADFEGCAPLEAAACSGAPDIVQQLIRAGARLDGALEADPDQCTALYTAVALAESEGHSQAHEDVATILLAAGADPTAAAVDGSTPISKAEESGNMKLVELLRAARNTAGDGRRKKRASNDVVAAA